MTPAILGTKIGMTRVKRESGEVVPVTVIKAGPCTVLQVRNADVDGYDAIQLGFEDVKPHRSTKPIIGHCGKAGTGPKRYVRELRLNEPSDVTMGEVVTVDSFSKAEAKYVDVVARTKGRGFAGVMKRHGFGGQQASHGVERKHRSSGSIGGHANLGLGRGVKKGKRMAGHMGDDRMTTANLELMKVDSDNGLLVVRGSIPGANGSLVFVKKAKKKG